MEYDDRVKIIERGRGASEGALRERPDSAHDRYRDRYSPWRLHRTLIRMRLVLCI